MENKYIGEKYRGPRRTLSRTEGVCSIYAIAYSDPYLLRDEVHLESPPILMQILEADLHTLPTNVKALRQHTRCPAFFGFKDGHDVVVCISSPRVIEDIEKKH